MIVVSASRCRTCSAFEEAFENIKRVESQCQQERQRNILSITHGCHKIKANEKKDRSLSHSVDIELCRVVFIHGLEWDLGSLDQDYPEVVHNNNT